LSVGTPPFAFPILSKIIVSCQMMPVRRQSGWAVESGRDQVIDRGRPQWMATWVTRELTPLEAGQVDAHVASLRGAQRFFTLHAPHLEYPVAYMPAGWGSLTRVGGGAFDGTASIASFGDSGLTGASRDIVNFGGSTELPAGLHLNPGDQFALEESGQISLHLVCDAAQITSGVDGTLAAWVEPEVPASFTSAAVARLYRASAKWRLLKAEATREAGSLRQTRYTISALSVYL